MTCFFFLPGYLILLLIFPGCGVNSENNTSSSQFQQDSCDDPDADINCCFINVPNDLTSTLTINGNDEQGEPLMISGTIYKKNGEPFPDLVLYAYHPDHTGHYSKKGKETGVQKWHGKLHGWC